MENHRPTMLARPHSIESLRTLVDAVDERLVAWLADRTQLVEAIAMLRTANPQTDEEIRQRIERVVMTAKGRAITAGAPPKVVEAVFRAMIDAFIEHQTQFVKRGQDNGEYGHL